MESLRWVAILSVLIVVLVLAGCAETMQSATPAGGKTVLRIASPFKPGHILVDAAQKFKDLVGQRSGGRLDVQIDAGTKSEEVINKIKSGEAAILVRLQRKGMQVAIPDAESFRVKAKPAVEELFKKEWSVTTWQEVLAF